jgi:hypothetical protein
MGAQVISTVQASLKLAAPDLPLRYFVVGKTWNWKNEEPYTFIENLKQIEKALKSGKLLYKTAVPGSLIITWKEYLWISDSTTGMFWVSHTIVPVNGAPKSVIIVFTIEFYFRIEHCRFRKVCC